jgi:acetylornithine deacetylase/succinyl-diaminopimelate desuccinylase-like protein
VTREAIRAMPYSVPPDNPGVQAVADVLKEFYGKEPNYVRIGGSLPIMDMFLQELKSHTVTLGFALPDQRAHSPNEFFRVSDYERGQAIYCRLLHRLASK